MIFRLYNKAREKLEGSQTINSGMWVAGGKISGQIIRLTSNLILTRLLVPEYFGLMAIVQAVLAFFTMMTDVGLLPNVINTSRDKEKAYMQTVWSVQVLAALVISCLVLIAAYPVSVFYNEPILFPLLAFSAITSLLAGFNSVSLLVEQKYIRQKQLVINQFFAQIISVLTMIGLAYVYGTVWSLAIGNLVSILFLLWASYKFFEGHFSVFKIEKKAFVEIITFGKWIFLASLFSYLSLRGTPLILGASLSMSDLGIYTVAAALAVVFESLSLVLASKILHPKYRQLIEKNKFRDIELIRCKFILVFILPNIILACSGEWLISLLYDDRYIMAGAMMQILILARFARLLEQTAKPLVVSMGDSKTLMKIQAVSAIFTVSALILVSTTLSLNLLILTIALLAFFDYFILRIVLNKKGAHIFKYDLLLIIPAIIFVLFVWYFFEMGAWTFIQSFTSLIIAN